MSAELIECLDALEADDNVRVIVLTGAGEKAFCAGADMAEAGVASGVGETALAIAQNSPSAVIASKEVVDLATTIPEAGKREMEHNLALRQGEDHRERFRAAAERVIGGQSGS